MYPTRQQDKPKIALVSLGCSKNIVDSENLLGEFYRADFELVGDPESADAVIVNTCGFIQPAVAETRDTLRQMIGIKNSQKDVRVYAMGCYVSRGTENWDTGWDGLDGVFALNQSDKIVSQIQQDLGFKSIQKPKTTYFMRPVSTTLPHYAYLKIAEGCNRTCTYCTIPSIRGDNVSKSIDNLVQETEELAKRGAKEVILIAQDTTAYGMDLYGKPSLLELLQQITQVIGIDWFRLFYAYPDHIDHALSTFLLENPKMVPYLDLPIQHSHPDVLRRMCRTNSFHIYDPLFDKLRAANPDYALRTTIITGFPGETDEEFDHMLTYIKEKQFDRLGVFKYVREDGTPADRLSGHLSEEEKEDRYNRIMLVQQETHFEKNKKLVGKKIPCIIDAVTDSGDFLGRTYRDAPDIDAAILIQSEEPLQGGTIGDVLITGTKDYDLLGQW